MNKWFKKVTKRAFSSDDILVFESGLLFDFYRCKVEVNRLTCSHYTLPKRDENYSFHTDWFGLFSVFDKDFTYLDVPKEVAREKVLSVYEGIETYLESYQ